MSKADFIEALQTREESSEPERVNHPAHYHADTIEVIDAIWAWKLNFNRGNVIKYIARAGIKDPARELEDLEKALCYLKDEIRRLKG
jgi:hypothetical protein